MGENSKHVRSYTIADKINENIVLLTHLAYIINFVVDSTICLLIAVILFFISKDTISKSHFKYIIITNVVLLIMVALISLITGLSLFNIFFGLADAVPDLNHTLPDGGYLKPFIIAGIGMILLVTWFVIRIIGGWVAAFRKEPIQGHFGIRWRKK